MAKGMLDLTVGHEHHPVDPLEDELAGSVVVHLTRHGVEVKFHLETADGAQVNRKKVEEQGPLRLGGQRDHLSPGGRRHLVVHVLQIGGLATQAGPVIHQLTVDLA
jgi:hypothetical protein